MHHKSMVFCHYKDMDDVLKDAFVPPYQLCDKWAKHTTHFNNGIKLLHQQCCLQSGSLDTRRNIRQIL